MSADETSGDRRSTILAAAVRVLAREGLGETTTRKIAAEAGINQATLAYYFGSKDGLLLAVLREMTQLTQAIARQAIARQAVPAGDNLRTAIHDGIVAFWEHVQSAPELQVLQYELTIYALRHPESAWLAREQYVGYCEVVRQLFAEACATSGQRCAVAFDELARFVVGGLDGMILQFVSDRDSVRARIDLAHLIAAVIALAEGAAPVETPTHPNEQPSR